MHTGYDNFWMHKNSRPKPVLNLTKYDNYSCALLTDNYKHMQSRGCPSHLSSFIPPQNKAASSHEKHHYRNSHDQSMWPSSVYSLPFMPSCANNLHPQEPFFSQTSNFVYSSSNAQGQEKHNFRHLETSNGNVNTLTMHNPNTSTIANNGLAHAQNNKNTNTHIPRIRVKDVFSLNNKSIQGQLELDGHFRIRQQKQLLGFSAHCNRALGSQSLTKYINYQNANLVESNKSCHFEHRTAKQTCLNNQEQFQNSCSFYQQNDGFSLQDFEFSGGRQIESSLSSESFLSSTPGSLLSQLLTQESILERGLQNRQVNAGGLGDTRPEHGGVKVTPMRNLAERHDPHHSDSDYSRSCGLNERALENGTSQRNANNVHCDLQENWCKINELNLKSRNSVSNITAKNAPSVTSESPPFKEINNLNNLNNQQNCFTKIRIPYTGKSSVISPNGCDDTEKNFAINLQSFFEQNEKNCITDRNTCSIIDAENGVVNSILPPIEQSNFISHHASPEAASTPDNSANDGGTVSQKNSVHAVSASLILSPRNRPPDTINQRPCRQEFDVLRNKDGDSFQHSIGAPEIMLQKFAMEISVEDDSTAEQSIPTNDFTAPTLTLKQESFHPETESASLQRTKNPPGGKEFHPTIKTEENSEIFTARECELELQSPNIVSEAHVEFLVEGCSSTDQSRRDSAPMADSEDHADKVNTIKSSSIKRDVQKSQEKKRRKVSLSRVNYKSNINRDKLDLLIQFLKKDRDSDGRSSCKERQSCRETANNANSDAYRSRRKLNKASIVRNKNNSREMISLMSPKGSKVTYKAPQITERSKNSEKTEAGKNSCSKDKVMTEESVVVYKEHMKCSNPCQENESKKDDSWTPEPNNEFTCLSKQQCQESSEKPDPKDKCAARDDDAVISTVRAFQNSKTHFCVSCKLVLSIESFWINMVSGEVRCLNCFKRKSLTAKAKENILKSKSNDLNDSSVKPLRKRKSKTEKENKSKDSANVDGSNSWDEGERKRNSKCEEALRKLCGMKENVREELLEMFVWEKRKGNERKETTNCLRRTRRSSSGDGVDSLKGTTEEKLLKTEKSAHTDISSEEVGRRFSENVTNQVTKDTNATRKRESSGEDFAKRERHLSSTKQRKASLANEQNSEGGAKEESALKSEKSHGRKASRSEEAPENGTKKEMKGVASSNRGRSSDGTEEEFRCHRMSIIEERGEKDLKIKHFTDESRKSLPKEGWPVLKEHAAEETAKRSARHETSDKSKNQKIWREEHLQRGQKCPPNTKTSALFSRRDPKAPNALARGTHNGVENQKRMESTEQLRKRKNSDEDFSPHKVHILQDFIDRNSVQATHPSKSSEAKASEENDNSQRGNFWSPRISTEKSGRSDASKEECVLFGEHLRKEAKPPSEGEKAKAKDLWKGAVGGREEQSDGFCEAAAKERQRRAKGPSKGRRPEKSVGVLGGTEKEVVERGIGRSQWRRKTGKFSGGKPRKEKVRRKRREPLFGKNGQSLTGGSLCPRYTLKRRTIAENGRRFETFQGEAKNRNDPWGPVRELKAAEESGKSEKNEKSGSGALGLTEVSVRPSSTLKFRPCF